MQKIRAALVGCGTIARVMHLPGLKAMEAQGTVEVVAVCDSSGEALETVRQMFEIPAGFTSVTALLEHAE
ncbi:MAG TPA: Gfo/Idh/MocA family oxidoreductase, partial [Isosphaeraceae bacterium]|nr:Gfo/Idh/MocA family oxidoreductase [Isosphaeraceae bacterium]